MVWGKSFPLVLESTAKSPLLLQECLAACRDEFMALASEHGAVVVKDTGIVAPEEWAAAICALGLKEMEYIGGAAVRKLVVGTEGRMANPQIVTTNESPPDQPIPFHHELAQTPDPPSHISFYCQRSAV